MTQMTIVAALFLLMGLAAFAVPRRFLGSFDLLAQTPTARNEIQAVYGGFGVAMALVLVAPFWLPQLRDGIAFTVALALAGMALGRVVGALREWPGPAPVLFFFVEAVGAGVLLSVLPSGSLSL
ncbi:DUF4345 family protein [Solimonas sp. K1W22B-7]|uniref:DUF4345 family protein n=1 Tax=Solimonas sp. K1W22B-7 TaxID=2303331 RepID=UPI0013C4C840|nr:DUF4345 family protein [Solimonas sp. K1W22B-7]